MGWSLSDSSGTSRVRLAGRRRSSTRESGFPLCAPGPLSDLFTEAGFADVETDRITIATVFRDFEDLWVPFTLGQGSAPGYVSSLSDEERERLRLGMMDRADVAPDGSIALEASAWTVRGKRLPAS